MYIDIVPNRTSPPAILLRESYREGGKAKKRTVLNLSFLTPAQAYAVRDIVNGNPTSLGLDDFDVVRSLPVGHVAAVLGLAKQLGFPKLLAHRKSRERDLVLAMLVARLLQPGSKLAMARALSPETSSNALNALLDLGPVDEDELYSAMDWLVERQGTIEKKLAKKHLHDGTLVLYDVTSVYFEGRTCELAHFGYSRDGKKKPQIVVGLLCNREGCPVAVEVFPGNTADPPTLASQIKKVRERFGLERVVFVGDRGMLTSARIREDIRPIEGLDWISALRSPQIRKLVEEGPLQPTLFDDRDIAEIEHEDFPDERLIACKNPRLEAERRRKREVLLERTEQDLEAIVAATQRAQRALKGKDKIAERVGRKLAKSKVAKHFIWEVDEDTLRFERNEESIAREEALDGIYVVRTSLAPEAMGTWETVAAYKGLSVVERAFRRLKTVTLEIRPIHHRLKHRVESHVFLCMLSYYLEWHMRQRLAPILFQDHVGAAPRTSVVAPARRSQEAADKAASKRTVADEPVHSLRTLLNDLGTIVRNEVHLKSSPELPLHIVTRPTHLQQRAFELLGVTPPR